MRHLLGSGKGEEDEERFIMANECALYTLMIQCYRSDRLCHGDM